MKSNCVVTWRFNFLILLILLTTLLFIIEYTAFIFTFAEISRMIHHIIYYTEIGILLRDEIASRNCSFTYFTACHACLFVLFSCHTNGKSVSPSKLNYFAFTQASRQTSWGGGESLFLVLREFSRSHTPYRLASRHF